MGRKPDLVPNIFTCQGLAGGHHHQKYAFLDAASDLSAPRHASWYLKFVNPTIDVQSAQIIDDPKDLFAIGVRVRDENLCHGATISL
jgi:hypothetical protein